MPLVICDLIIRWEAIRLCRYEAVPASVPVRAIALVYATWPIYTLAWIMALLHIPLRFRPTPKSSEGKFNPTWVLPQTVAVIALMIGGLGTLTNLSQVRSYLLLSYFSVQALLQLWPIGSWVAWYRRRRLSEGSPHSFQAADA
jgi:hypothetical protein